MGRIVCLLLLLASPGQADWVARASGTSRAFHTTHFQSAAIGWVGGDSGVLLKTVDSGKTWQPKNSGTTDLIRHLQFVTDSVGWFLGAGAALYKTTNRGDTWQLYSRDTSWSKSIRSLHAVQFFAGDTFFAVGRENTPTNPLDQMFEYQQYALLQTDDAGASWQIKKTSVRFNRIATSDAYRLHFVSKDTGWFFGGSSRFIGGLQNEITSSQNEVWKTSDGGATWTAQTLPMLPVNRAALLTSAHFPDPDTGWIVGGLLYQTDFSGMPATANTLAAIYVTQNGGATWGMQAVPDGSIFRGVQFLDAANGWAMGDNGRLLKTMDGGGSWVADQVGLTTALRGFYFTGPQAGWSVGMGGLMWKYDASVSGVRRGDRAASGNLLEISDLSGNFARVGFRIENPEPNVTLKILDIKGREVATPANRGFSAGRHEVSFDVTKLSGGVYYCVLRTSRSVETLRMVRIR